MALFVLSITGLTIIFVSFLVIVRTLGSIIQYLTKVEYWVTQEIEFKKEQEEIRKALEADEVELARKKEEPKGKSLFDLPFTPGAKSDK